MEKPELKKVPARCGCEGCYFDTHGGCEVDKYIEEKGLPPPPFETWACGSEETSFIFVAIKEAE